MKRITRFLTATSSYYAPSYLGSLVLLLEKSDYRVGRYLKTYWTMQDFGDLRDARPGQNSRNRTLLVFVYLGALLQIMIAIALLVYVSWHDIAGALPFGLALLVSYPVVWAHMLAVAYGFYKVVWTVRHPKIVGRAAVCAVLENQVVRLRQKHTFTVIAVAGSVGKTSTKLAIAHTLEPSRRVIYQTGNYNDRVTVPLVLFGHELPNLFNILAWTKIFLANERAIGRPFFYDVAVFEIGTDRPGDLAHFAYLKPEVSVVTAITPEHMEFFKTLDAVAGEELTVCDYSRQVLVNADDTPRKYLEGRHVLTYGSGKEHDFQTSGYKSDGLKGGTVKLRLQDKVAFQAKAAILGEQGVKIVLAAAAAAQLAGLTQAEIVKGLQEIKPFAGRMQILGGINGSTIIDDTYNASPAPVKAALDVLYATTAPQRIAILGNMNELGDYSPEAHTEVGGYCRADKLDLVVTIGPDAEKFLAPAAQAQGCNVQSFASPYAAGECVREHLKKNAVILAEGSQNGVFAEESLKVLLASAADEARLVRQSDYWMRIKRGQFDDRQLDK